MPTSSGRSRRNDSNLIFIDLRKGRGRAQLEEELGSQDGESHGLTPPVQRLMTLITGGDCRTAVLERDYIDLDHRAALSRFYRLRHRDTRARCTRVHLFADVVTAAMLEQGLGVASYRGFLVLRPFSHETLGRCILSGALIPHPGENFLTCKAPYTVHLAGHRIQFEGAPWMQQDRMVAACASAAMWVTGWHLAHFLGREHRLYTTPEITELATQFALSTGRAMPSGGLTLDQMASGFRGMGYEPILLDEPETPTAFQARHLTYAYIESGIPAVLSLNFPVDGGHAIAVMGHALSVGREPQWEVFESRDSPQLRFADASQFAPAFVAQDDAGGPFRSIEFIDQRDWASDSVVRLLQRKKEFRTSYLALKDSFTCGVVLDRDTPEPEFGFLQGILIPSPPRVTLGPDDAQRKACALLVKAEQEFRPHLSGGFVLRTYLRRSNAFKSHCRSAGALLPETTRRLCWHPMPKWLWITEVSDLAHHRRREECIAGLIIQDAAGHIEAQPMEDLIAMVTPSSLILGHPDSKAPLLDAELSRHRQGFFSRFARPRDGGTKHT